MDVKELVKAARLRTLPLSISGIIVGSFIAASEGFFNVTICVLALLTTVGFQIISNFANDYGDGVKGTDNNERVGPQRAIQSGKITPKQLLKVIKISIAITLIIAVLLIYVSFGKEDFFNLIIFFVLGIASIAAAIKYTMGKNAYGYSGFGDVFVFIFFGLVSVCGSYYLYAKQLNFTVFLPAFSIGFLSIGVLNLNNMRDRESDIKSGKNTLVVKIGIEFAKYYHYYLLIASFLFALLYTMIHFNSFYQFIFVAAYLPIAKHLLVVYKNEKPRLLDPELKKLAISTFIFSVLFGLGLVL
ncbi:1,4-dihydroxy-2-naphthoate polyprenyltransferase [Lutibacter maritimus]|uniref:1,4-dihydroxy-2-naphthoate octaprenyltransferase n=1 Tax=Lutibacter maritimus TaxID=593133 RepID=A0A1I6S1B3_9FLAO|nr:1,4-dihydroxy-2-naphthoate polyprenyltransferase [Lutibacter maritimus]SFS70706.1 1,4-dihydroxy-2-naphthoate prenyltransferase [Lutibacter maritimus]